MPRADEAARAAMNDPDRTAGLAARSAPSASEKPFSEAKSRLPTSVPIYEPQAMVSVATGIEGTPKGTMTARCLALALFAAISLYLLALFHYVYEFRADGMAYVAGEILGALLITGLVLFKLWKRPLGRVAIFGIVSAFIAYHHSGDLVLGVHVHEAKALLASGVDEGRIKAALAKSPNNRMLGFLNGVLLSGRNGTEKIFALISSIEPEELNKLNLRATDRRELEDAISHLQAAERNSHSALSKYDEIAAEQRREFENLIEKFGLTKRGSKSAASGIEQSQRRVRALIGEQFKAQEELYQSLRSLVDFLLGQSGKYVVYGERFIFSDDISLKRFNELVADVGAKAGTVDGLQKKWAQVGEEAGRAWSAILD